MNDEPGREVAIFTQAVRLPVQQRAVFLEQACCGDEDLRRKLEALLGASERSGDFLEEPAIPPNLATLLRERADPANPKAGKKARGSFQPSRRKRKG
jgi:hypothetical protein